jgi:hypothetical protein
VEFLKFDLFSFSIEGGYTIDGAVDYKHVGTGGTRDFFCVDISHAPYAKLNLFEDTLIDKWLDCQLTFNILENNDKNPCRKQGIHLENFSSIVSKCSYGPTATINYSTPSFKSSYRVEQSEGGVSVYQWSNVKTTVYIYDCAFVGSPAAFKTRLELDRSGTSGAFTFSFNKTGAYGDCVAVFSVYGDLKITTTDSNGETYTHEIEGAAIYSSNTQFQVLEGETVSVILAPLSDHFPDDKG